jgi:hypothetical protein
MQAELARLLLLWLARRTYQDHWYDENNQPYYRAAANLYVEGAHGLIAGGSDLTSQQKQLRLAKVTAAQQYVEQKAALDARLVRPRRPNFTGESEITLLFALDRGAVPAGYPVAWLTASRELQVPNAGVRQVLDLKEKPAKELTFPLQRPAVAEAAKRVDRLESTLEVRFRGQRRPVPTEVKVYHRPDVIWSQPEPPPEAGVAVRADKALHDRFSPTKGAIAIVLDCSGSMAVWPNGRAPTAAEIRRFQQKTYPGHPCRFHQATQALRQVLEGQPDKGIDPLPDGVQLSVIVFSQAELDANGDIAVRQPSVEKTIRVLRPPTPWERRTQLKQLMADLESLVPYRTTPLVRAMSVAKDEGFLRTHRGFKTLLVLTDGEDNRFNSMDENGKPVRDTDLIAKHKTDDIGKFLFEEFKDSKIKINLIGFQVEKAEKENLIKQFEEPLKRLPLRSKVYTSEEIAQLQRQLARSLRQKLSFTTLPDRELTPSREEDEGHTVSVGWEDDDWVLVKPGHNRVRVELDEPLQQDLDLKPGDFLLVKVRDDARGFERLAYGDDWRKPQTQHDVNQWAVTLLQNQLRRTEKRLDLMVAVESRRERVRNARGFLEQIYPRQVWFDVKPAGGEPFDGTLHWTELRDYPGPSLGLELTDWPPRAGGADPAAARVTVYWNGDENPRLEAEIPLRVGANIRGFEGEEAPLASHPGDKVVLEKVDVQKFKGPGREREEDCLIVWASHPPGKPVWVLPDSNLKVLAQEHRFYNEADKYMGVFVIESAAAANALLKRFYVYSVPAFKAAPKTLNYTLEPKTPADRDPRPESVFQLRGKANK